MDASPEYDSLTFGIGGITAKLSSADPGLRIEASRVFRRFLTPGATPRIHVRAAWGEFRGFDGEPLFDSGSLWRAYRAGADFVYDFASPVFGELPYKRVVFNSSFTAGEIQLQAGYFDRGQPVFPLETPLDELLFVNHLGTGYGVDLHACGIVDSDGTGRLFLGSSGAGKTTMARQWRNAPGIEILSDDRIILRHVDGRLLMYGTPWHGEAQAASPTCVPVSQVFFLARGPRNEALALRPAAAVARLLAVSFLPFHNAGALDYTLAFFENAVRTVPVRELRVVPDERVVGFLRGLTG